MYTNSSGSFDFASWPFGSFCGAVKYSINLKNSIWDIRIAQKSQFMLGLNNDPFGCGLIIK